MVKAKKIKKVTIIGAGSWGTAIAKVIAENRPETLVMMWAYEKATVNSINNKNINTEFLPDVKLPLNIKATAHLSESLSNTQCLIIATPSKVIPETVTKISRIIGDDIPMAYLTKGFCRIGNEILTISQAVSKLMPSFTDRVIALYGPSHAEEVVSYYHTCITVAGKSEEERKVFSELLSCDYMSCRETDDIIGVDLGGTLKNPAAIAAGIISMLPRCGDNLGGALMAESLKEMLRLGRAMGGNPDTITDISGTGDLVATALSEHSRNRRFGKDIARQILEKGTTLSMTDKIYLRFKPEYVLEKMARNLHYLAEGAYAIEPLMELAEKHSVSIPVYRSLYEVLLNKKEPSLLIETIKDPERFNEIYASSKIHVKEKKKGLEKIKGKVFKKQILTGTHDRFFREYITDINKTEQVITQLKSCISSGNISRRVYKKEIKLIMALNQQNFEKIFNRLTVLYLKEISDHYSLVVNGLFFRVLDFLYYRKRLTGAKNRLKITGEIRRVYNIRSRFNILYVMRHRNIYDFIYYLVAIKKSLLPVPRFFVHDSILKKSATRFLIKRSGGFVVDTSRLNNAVYRECLIQYLSILIKHGVPVLFFPELNPSPECGLTSLSENFFRLLNEVMYEESTEIALVPGSICYNSLIIETVIRPPFREAVTVNLSDPIFLSDFTKESSSERSVPDYINEVWASDEIILPKHIICGILDENNNVIKTNRLRKSINKYLNSKNIVSDKNAKHIFSEGLKFLLKNGVVIKKDNYVMAANNSVIKQYAELINRKEESLKTRHPE